MRKKMVLITMLATLLTAMLGHAPQSMAQDDASDPEEQGFVGSWHVGFVIDGQPRASNLISFTSDGLILHSNQATTQTGSGVPADVVFQSGGHGVWTSSGERTADITFMLLQSDADGNDLGTRTIRGTLELDESGDAWSGTYTATVADAEGEVLQVSEGMVEGTRIVVEPMEELATPAS